MNVLLETVISWGGRNLNAHEELSCSYQPSRKKRGDIIHNGGFQRLNLSKATTKGLMECDSSNDITTPWRSEWRQDNYFMEHSNYSTTDFDDTEKSFEHLRHNMDPPRTRR